MTARALIVSEYINWYLTYFDVTPFLRKKSDVNELQIGDLLGKHRKTAVADWARDLKKLRKFGHA